MKSKRIPLTTKNKLWMRCQGHCEARMEGCEDTVIDPHHIKSKKRGGSNELINLLGVCRSCHTKITANKPDTEGFRSHSWNKEGISELGTVVMLKKPDGTEMKIGLL